MIHAGQLRLSLRALSGRMGGEWERDRRDTLFLMGAILLSALPQTLIMPVWASIAFLMMFGWRLALLFSGRPMPPVWLRMLGAAAAIAGVFAEYSTLFGREPGVLMLVLFLGLKLLEMRARRDLFVVLFLCFLLLLTGFFGSQSLPMAGLTLLAVVALVAAMITMQYGAREAAIGRRLRQAALIVAQAVPLALILFVLFPRLATPLWGLQGGGAAASTGLSDSMAPGEVTDLARSAAVAFRVEFDGEAPPRAMMYWRGPVFGHFDGRRWYSLLSTSASGPPELLVDGAPLGYSVTLESNGQPWLLALDMPGSLAGLPGGEVVLDGTMAPRWSRPVTNRIRYRAESYARYRLEPRATPNDLRRWLRLPDGFNPRMRALADDWRTRYPDESAGDRVQRILTMFREQPFRYTLQPPGLGRDTVDEFLFDSRAGFCEHYTSAFVNLMRALGVPSRVVTGYQGAEPSPVDDYHVVRQSDAHAWAEVWLEGEGWVRVDPTAAVAPERIETGARLRDESAPRAGDGTLGGLMESLRLNLDVIAHRWNQWVLQFDSGSQRRLLERLGMPDGDWRSLSGLLALATLLMIGASALFALKPRPRRDPIGDAWRDFCAKLAASGLPRAPHETAGAFLARIGHTLPPAARNEAARIVALYTRLRYGELSNPRSVRERRTSNVGGRASPAETRKIILANEGVRRLRAAVRSFQPGKTPVER